MKKGTIRFFSPVEYECQSQDFKPFYEELDMWLQERENTDMLISAERESQ